jgi:hypothetical protein
MAYEELTPADPRDLAIALALGLTAGSRLAKFQSAEVMATVVAERLVEHLSASGFVVMRKPVPIGDAGNSLGAKAPGH